METELWTQFDRIVVFDTETTGIDFGRDEIIELGAAAYTAAGEAEHMDLLIQLTPGRTLPPFITRLTGITPEQLEPVIAALTGAAWRRPPPAKISVSCWGRGSGRCWPPTTPSST